MKPWGYVTGWIESTAPAPLDVSPGVTATIDGLAFRVVTADRFPDGRVMVGLGERVDRRPPGMDGPACPRCGGMTQRTGTCATCTNCGETTGCG